MAMTSLGKSIQMFEFKFVEYWSRYVLPGIEVQWRVTVVIVSTGSSRSGLETTVLSTTRVKLLVALSDRVLTAAGFVSETLTRIKLVVEPCAAVGVQAIAPDGDTVNPLGPLTRAKARLLAGRSASVAVALALKATSSLMV